MQKKYQFAVIGSAKLAVAIVNELLSSLAISPADIIFIKREKQSDISFFKTKKIHISGDIKDVIQAQFTFIADTPTGSVGIIRDLKKVPLPKKEHVDL
jgi:pyrroline-5-carboxylate reductase